MRGVRVWPRTTTRAREQREDLTRVNFGHNFCRCFRLGPPFRPIKSKAPIPLLTKLVHTEETEIYRIDDVNGEADNISCYIASCNIRESKISTRGIVKNKVRQG